MPKFADESSIVSKLGRIELVLSCIDLCLASFSVVHHHLSISVCSSLSTNTRLFSPGNISGYATDQRHWFRTFRTRELSHQDIQSLRTVDKVGISGVGYRNKGLRYGWTLVRKTS